MNFDHDTFESPSWVDPGNTHGYANTVTPKPPRIDREQAHRMLALLGGKDPSTTRLRAFAHKDNPDKARLRARSGGWDLDSAEQWQAEGRGLYLVINDGGDTKASITNCRAVFVEWDDKLIEWQRHAWRELGLPEPTFQVETGGKSVHTYWTLAEPLPRDQWEPLQACLIEHCGSDHACKDASRVMRLAGAHYIGPDGRPVAQSNLIECSGQPVALESILAALPAEAPAEPPPAPRPTRSTSPRDHAPRNLEQIQAALGMVPRRSSKTYELFRNLLCGLIAAVEEAGGTEAQAIALMEAHSPSKECGWDIAQVARSTTTRSPATFWAICREHGFNLKRTATPKATGGHRKAAQAQDGAAASSTPTHVQREHYLVLGWDSDRSAIWYQPRATGQIVRIPATGRALLRLAPIDYWEMVAPADKKGVDWDTALSAVIEQANDAGVFQPEDTRGRGIWIDDGRTIWHLGDRLEVNGKIVALIDHQSAFRYARLPALPINPAVAALTDEQGFQITDAVARMGWATQIDHLIVTGWTVCSIAGGAIPHRPGLQLSSGTGSGKSTTTRRVWRPLFAGAALLRSGSTEAGIRQLAGPDALPVVVDETEAGEGRGRREGMLRLMRHSYDGTPLDKGTTHGSAISYPVRFAMALLAVNGSVALATDANRLATASRSPIPMEQWHQVERDLQALVTPAAGAALHRRIVDHLPVLLANINAFHRAVERLAPAGIQGRTADTYAPLLAGAHLLISTEVLDDAQAAAWLVHAGWGAGALGDAAENGADAEGRQLLELILAHEIQWREPSGEQGSGRRSIGALIDMARHKPADEGGPAADALAECGLKVWESGLLVATPAAPLAQILKGTRWADGGHTARLRDLPGAETGPKERIMRGRNPCRSTRLPWSLIDDGG